MDNLVSHELMIPHSDNEGNALPHLLGAVKHHLAQNGIPGFTIHAAKGTWTDPESGEEYPDEDMHHIMADVPDTPQNDDLFSRLAEAVAHEGRQQAVYHRKTPVQVAVHQPRQHPDIDLSPVHTPGGGDWQGMPWPEPSFDQPHGQGSDPNDPDFATSIFG